MIAPVCPYCELTAKLVDSIIIHGKSFGPVWLCRDCNAYVGCHKGTHKPLGTLANGELRTLRKTTHSKFDPLWETELMTRNAAYAWLATQLRIPPTLCHIAMFDETLCEKTIMICDELYTQYGVDFHE